MTWINVKHSLPALGREVLIINEFNNMPYIASLEAYPDIWRNSERQIALDVKWWMDIQPFPEIHDDTETDKRMRNGCNCKKCMDMMHIHATYSVGTVYDEILADRLEASIKMREKDRRKNNEFA